MDIQIADIIVGTRFRKDFGDLETLAKSITELGLLQPIGVTEDNRLICGERRLRATRDILGWQEIPARVVNLQSLISGEYAENEVRKDFTVSERVAIGKAIEDELGNRQGQRTDQLPANLPEVPKGTETRDIAAAKSGFGGARTYDAAKAVVEKGAPELVGAMDAGGVSISAAADIATLPQAEQAEIVARGEREILAASKQIRADRAETRRGERIEKIQEITANNAELNEGLGKFPVIYVDPPWRYDYAETENRAIENQYPTMLLDEICALSVGEIALDDAVLFLWATSPKLEDAFKVLNAWGFTYKTSMVWDKEKIGMGYYARQQHEILLICTKGALPAPAPSARPSSVFREAREGHSSKPIWFYERRKPPNLALCAAIHARLPALISGDIAIFGVVGAALVGAVS